MRPASHDHRRLFQAAVVCAVLLGCGGKGGDGGSVVTPPPPPTQTFRCSQSPVMIDRCIGPTRVGGISRLPVDV